MRKGESFLRTEKITRAHDRCEICDSVEQIAINIYRTDGRIKTQSSAGEHWVVVERKVD